MIERVTVGKALPAEVQEQLLEKTNGVPLFVEELTKMVLESGLVKEKDGHYELAEALASLAIPTTLQDSLMARLDRQGVGKPVAQLGATLGREFSYGVLQAVAPLDEATLQQGLEQLVGAEILYQRGLPPQAQYVFKHALIQEVAYQSLLRSTRQQYHRQIAQVLEERFPETCASQPELVAHHYTEAGLSAQAVVYWQQAGQRAIERSAYVEALQHLSQGLAVLASLPATTERLQHELTLRMALGTALMAVKGQTAPEVEQTYARAYELCRQVRESPQLFPVLVGLWRFYGARGELPTARELAEQLMQIAQHTQDSGLLVEAHMALGNSLFFDGKFVTARAHFEQGIALYNLQQHRSHTALYGRDPGVVCASINALTLWKLGYPEQAVRLSHKALTLARELSSSLNLSFALYQTALLHQFRREPQVAREFAEAAITLATEQELGPWIVGQATVQCGWALVMQGQGEEGLLLIQNGLATLRSIGAEMPWPLFQLVDAYRNLGQAEEGLHVLVEVSGAYWLKDKEVLGQTPERQCVSPEMPGMYWLKGELLLRLAVPDEPQAEMCFHQALHLARHQGAKSDELRVTTSLSRLWYRQGKRDVARHLLAENYGWFTEGLDIPDLMEARALLEELM
jgi:predicted ATPase